MNLRLFAAAISRAVSNDVAEASRKCSDAYGGVQLVEKHKRPESEQTETEQWHGDLQ